MNAARAGGRRNTPREILCVFVFFVRLTSVVCGCDGVVVSPVRKSPTCRPTVRLLSPSRHRRPEKRAGTSPECSRWTRRCLYPAGGGNMSVFLTLRLWNQTGLLYLFELQRLSLSKAPGLLTSSMAEETQTCFLRRAVVAGSALINLISHFLLTFISVFGFSLFNIFSDLPSQTFTPAFV